MGVELLRTSSIAAEEQSAIVALRQNRFIGASDPCVTNERRSLAIRRLTIFSGASEFVCRCTRRFGIRKEPRDKFSHSWFPYSSPLHPATQRAGGCGRSVSTVRRTEARMAYTYRGESSQ